MKKHHHTTQILHRKKNKKILPVLRPVWTRRRWPVRLAAPSPASTHTLTGLEALTSQEVGRAVPPPAWSPRPYHRRATPPPAWPSRPCRRQAAPPPEGGPPLPCARKKKGCDLERKMRKKEENDWTGAKCWATRDLGGPLPTFFIGHSM
jgi:hypothetical protein